jgi:spore germination protein GerM
MRRAGLVGLAIALAACGFPTQDAPHPVDVDEAPLSSTSDTAPVRNEEVTVWFVDDDHLASSGRSVPSPVTATAALAATAAGVSASESAAGLRSAIPDPAMVLGATVAGGAAIVDLAPDFLDIPAGDQVLALAQIVYTLTDLRGIGRVRFQIDGEPVAVPLPDGGSTSDSVSREDFAALS